jgi:hypothetical protein
MAAPGSVFAIFFVGKSYPIPNQHFVNTDPTHWVSSSGSPSRPFVIVMECVVSSCGGRRMLWSSAYWSAIKEHWNISRGGWLKHKRA